MHLIAVHKFQKESTARHVFYLNPDHISMVEGLEDHSRVQLSNGNEFEVSELVDELMTKIKGFTKPIRAPHLEHAQTDKLHWE